MLVSLSLYVVLSILLSILVILLSILVAAASLFCVCLVSVQFSCAICRSWQHIGVVHLSLQADGKVAFEDIPVFGVCRSACHDSSLYLFVLVLFLDTVVLSQVHVTVDNLYEHIVQVYRHVFYNHHLCLGDVHLKTHSSTFSG